MSKKAETEIVNVAINARNIAAVGRVVRRAVGAATLSAENIGFEPPKNYLQINGPVPTLAELTVMAQKLGLQIKITHLELSPLPTEPEKENDKTNDKSK